MAKITFIQPNGSKQVVEAEVGLTVMEAAKKALIAGIEAECGGACSCATCHVYVDETWRAKVGKPSEMEEDMLDFAFDVRKLAACPARSRSPAISTASWSRSPISNSECRALRLRA